MDAIHVLLTGRSKSLIVFGFSKAVFSTFRRGQQSCLPGTSQFSSALTRLASNEKRKSAERDRPITVRKLTARTIEGLLKISFEQENFLTAFQTGNRKIIIELVFKGILKFQQNNLRHDFQSKVVLISLLTFLSAYKRQVFFVCMDKYSQTDRKQGIFRIKRSRVIETDMLRIECENITIIERQGKFPLKPQDLNENIYCYFLQYFFDNYYVNCLPLKTILK